MRTGSANASASPKGELGMRATGRQPPSRMSRLLASLQRRHLQITIRDWTSHYNRGRPHSALGPGLPEPMSGQLPCNEHRHRLPVGYRVVKRSVLGGLHHEYGLMKEAV